MKISGTASLANHGTQSIELEEPRIVWSKDKQSVILEGYRIGDFSPASSTKHNYEVEIPIAELAEIIRGVGAIRTTDESANIVRKAFISEVAQLIRIQNICINDPLPETE